MADQAQHQISAERLGLRLRIKLILHSGSVGSARSGKMNKRLYRFGRLCHCNRLAKMRAFGDPDGQYPDAVQQKLHASGFLPPAGTARIGMDSGKHDT